MPLPATLPDVTQAHLEQLVSAREPEGPHQDFKRELPTNWDDKAKARFIADVVALANAGGGDLVFGVDEDPDACAAAIVPQTFASADVEVRRLQDFMLNSIEPRLPGAQVHAVPLSVASSTGHALVVRVPQSWAAPHRSKVNWHFYVRDGVRNRQLDVPEVRALFLRADSQAQRMRDFRSDRLAKVVTGQTPVQLGVGPKLVVHAISTQAAVGQVFIDPVAYVRGGRNLPALGESYLSGVGLNLDGAFGEIPTPRPRKVGYTQQFRQGYFEAVWEQKPLGNEPGPILPGVAYEREINRFLGAARVEFRAHGVAPEMAVFLALIGADGLKMAGPSDWGPGWSHSLKTFDRRDVLLPDVLIDPDVSVGKGMRPAYDLMCQAAGYVGSANYDEQGEWKASR